MIGSLGGPSSAGSDPAAATFCTTSRPEVTVPKDLNSKARSAIEDLREATAGQDPREELLERAKEA